MINFLRTKSIPNKKGTIIFLIVALFSANVKSQDTSVIKHANIEPVKFKIGLNFSPGIGYRTIVNNRLKASVAPIIKESLNKLDSISYTYSTGIKMEWNIQKQWIIQLGFQFSRMRFSSGKDEPTGAYIFYTNNSPNTVYEFSYIDIPVFLSYIIGKKKWQIIPAFGLTPNLLINENSYNFDYLVNGTMITSPVKYKMSQFPLTASAIASIGINYNLSRKLTLRLSPQFKHALTPINQSNINIYLYSSNIDFTIFWNVK